MIVVTCINFLLPTMPLLTLSLTRFGLKSLPRKLLLVHKLCLAYLVNLPLFTTRMITWHGLRHGISMFTLKNVVVMGVVTFDVLEKWYLEVDKTTNAGTDKEIIVKCKNEENTVDSNDKVFDESRV